MASKAPRSDIPGIPDFEIVQLTKLRPKEKGSLLRRKFQVLGVHLECQDNGKGRLRPAHEFEILFSGDPQLSMAWHYCILSLLPKEEVEQIRAVLKAANIVRLKREKETETNDKKALLARRRKLLRTVREANAKKHEEITFTQKVVQSSSAQKFEDCSVYKGQQDRRSVERIKKLLINRYDRLNDDVANERLHLPISRVKNYVEAYSKIVASKDTEERLFEELVSLSANNETWIQKRPVDNEVSAYWKSLKRLMHGNHPTSILDVLIRQGMNDISLIQEKLEGENWEKQAIEMNFSIDDSGFIKDESEDANLDKQKKRQRRVREELQMMIIRQEILKSDFEKKTIRAADEYTSAKEALKEELFQKGVDAESLMSDLERQCRKASLQASVAILKAEKIKILAFSDDMKTQEIELKKKLHDDCEKEKILQQNENVIEALSMGWTEAKKTLSEKLKSCRDSFEVEPFRTKIRATVGANVEITDFVKTETDKLKQIDVDRLPFYFVNGRCAKIADSPVESDSFDLRYSSIDTDVARNLCAIINLPRSQLTWPSVARALAQRTKVFLYADRVVGERPTVKNPDMAADAEQAYAAEMAKNAKETETALAACGLEVNQLMGKAVALNELERVHREQPGFYVIRDVKVDGKSLYQWKEIVRAKIVEALYHSIKL